MRKQKTNPVNDNKLLEELKFWEQNRFSMFINKEIPVKVPDIGEVADLLKHVKENRDYYAVVERVRILKQMKK